MLSRVHKPERFNHFREVLSESPDRSSPAVSCMICYVRLGRGSATPSNNKISCYKNYVGNKYCAGLDWCDRWHSWWELSLLGWSDNECTRWKTPRRKPKARQGRMKDPYLHLKTLKNRMLESHNVYYRKGSNSNKEMRGYKLSILGLSEVVVRF